MGRSISLPLSFLKVTLSSPPEEESHDTSFLPNATFKSISQIKLQTLKIQVWSVRFMDLNFYHESISHTNSLLILDSTVPFSKCELLHASKGPRAI